MMPPVFRRSRTLPVASLRAAEFLHSIMLQLAAAGLRASVVLLAAGLLSPPVLYAQDAGRGGSDASPRAAVPPDAASADRAPLALTAVHEGGIVQLRWAPADVVTWNLMRRGGVMLTRQAGAQADTTVLNGGAPLRVWSAEQWKAHPDLRGAPQALQLLADDADARKGLSPWAEADLDRNTLTGLLLLAEFNFDLAHGLALAYTDSSAARDVVHRYEIRVVDDVRGDTLRAECFVDTGDDTPALPVTGLRAEAADGAIDLWWTRAPAHSGYHVERRAAGTTAWTRLTTQPKLFSDNYPDQRLHRDSVANGRTYEYRVLGVDAFGREAASLATVTATARDLTPPEPPYDLRWEKTADRVRITWKLPPAEPDLAGYGLLRSVRPDDGYEPVHRELLAPGTTSHLDAVPRAGTYFYRMFTSDTAGNISSMSVRAMAVIDDTLAPAAPEGLVATADTNGVITVRWRMTHGDDVAGFRVYRIIDGGRSPEFVPLHGSVIADTVWRDTLMADVRDRFLYRVRTVDLAGNYSAPSAPVAVRFPDRTPPVRPVIVRSSVDNRSVALQFASPSTDVAAYRIRRVETPGAAKAFETRTVGGSWRDTTARHGVMYRYTVAAEDSAGNVSEASDVLHVQPFWSETLPDPSAPVCRHDAARGVVRVTWALPPGAGWSAIVFRRIDAGPWLQLSPQLTATSYDDASPRSGALEYAVRYYLAGQGGSELGAGARVVVP